jgi:hypothetical protein
LNGFYTYKVEKYRQQNEISLDRPEQDSAIAWGGVEIALLRLVLASGRAEAEAFAHALPESFSFFRRPVPAALSHAMSEIGAAGTVPSDSAEEYPAQGQKSKRLPEGEQAPAEERRQQPIPQVHHDFTADEGK